MPSIDFKQLLEAGVHFGHLKRKWNPNMAPYILMEKNGIHIIDLHKTAVKIDEAAAALRQIAKSGRRVLFVATKKQAKDIVSEKVSKVNMPYVTERWPGGMLTNFPTIRKAVKKMGSIDKMMKEKSWDNLSKREKLQITRQRAKLDKILGSIADLTRLPAALFVVDVLKERIAVREAQRLGIPLFAMVDTNSDPDGIDFVVPANDDASQSISLIVNKMCEAIGEGLNERKFEREKEAEQNKSNKKANAKSPAKKEKPSDVKEAPNKGKKPADAKKRAPVKKTDRKEKTPAIPDEKKEELIIGQKTETEGEAPVKKTDRKEKTPSIPDEKKEELIIGQKTEAEGEAPVIEEAKKEETPAKPDEKKEEPIANQKAETEGEAPVIEEAKKEETPAKPDEKKEEPIAGQKAETEEKASVKEVERPAEESKDKK